MKTTCRLFQSTRGHGWQAFAKHCSCKQVFKGVFRFIAGIHISILGTPDDYAVEVTSGAWFESIIFPGAVGLIVDGPIGLAGGAAFGGIMAYEYEKHMWKKILEVVKRESKVQPTVDSIEHYHAGVA